MEPNQRFTILTFPQFFDGNILSVNVVFLPRNQNPLMNAIEGAAADSGRACRSPTPSFPSSRGSSADFPACPARSLLCCLCRW